MTTTTTATTTTGTRFHVGLHVADLARSVRFYRALLGVGPTKNLPDHAKFEPAEPALVLGLYPSPQPPGGALNHVGLRFPDSAALVEVQRRLEEAGIPTERQEGVECCYARQTKFWVSDPDRVLWEVYTLHDDLGHSGFDDPPPATAPPSEAVWQHRVTDAVPARIPRPDDSLDEVMLEGTFNAPAAPHELAALLREAMRALKPGGKLAAHALVGDKPFPGAPKLPGLASLVKRVPVETEPLAALAAAGFAGLFFEKLGDIHCFSAGGVELRELRLVGWKPAPEGAGPAAVLYKGPFASVESECGAAFKRGEAAVVPAAVAARLRSGPGAESFAFLTGGR